MNDIKLPDYLPSWMSDHVNAYLENGEAAHLWDASLGGGEGMLTTLLLTTKGRKSGKTLIIPLIYRPSGDGGFCVIASKGGAPAHPAWFLNLQTNQNITVKVANDEFKTVAKVAAGEERARLWNMMENYFSPYAAYKAATDREIPVVVLYPA
ncbi:nitroreductase/quinone reductase family protein [Zhongshania sp.]|uniref:nitroreductase/quinone reductase family protein n=1 Tax=Zhongshania sp. TaxID=1971902 RepID=UPI003562F6FE